MALFALAAACENFGSGDDEPVETDAGKTADTGGFDAGPRIESDAGIDSAAPDAALPRWCDGGHTFCADFDDLTASDSLFKGWTEAARSTTGIQASLTEDGPSSAPNAARLELAAGKHSYYLFSKTIDPADDGARIKTASLSFGMRPKLGPGDAGDTHYTIGAAKLRNASGDVVGSANMDWKFGHVVVLGWIGGGGLFGGDPYATPNGTLSGDEWLTVTISFDLTDSTNQKLRFKVQDSSGAKLGESSMTRNWPDIASITFEVGVWDSDEQRLPLTLRLDNVVADVTH